MPVRFGGAGQVVISSDIGLYFGHGSVSGSDASSTNILLRPAFDYFVIDSLSIGGLASLDYTKQGGDERFDSESTTLGAGLRVGYDIPLSELFSIWPRLAGSAAHILEEDGNQYFINADGGDTAFNVSLYVPVLLHPAQHFFVGFGPSVSHTIAGDSSSTALTAGLTLGGWI